MIPLRTLSLEDKLFFLSAAEFGGRLFLGPGGPGGTERHEWLEIVIQAPAELVNMLPDDRMATASGDPDFALPALLARLTDMPAESMARDLHREYDRLFLDDASGTAGQLATELEYLTALLAKGFFGKTPDPTARVTAKALCGEVLVPRLDGLVERLAATDQTGVFAAAAVVLRAVTGDLAQRI